MQYSITLIIAAAAYVSAHGVVTSIQGANGVTMPGLSVIDGTRRDCATPACGAEADTTVFRAGSGPLGATNGGGQVTAAKMMAVYMGGSTATGGTTGKRGLADLLGGGGTANDATTTNGGSTSSGTKIAQGSGAKESGVAAAAGKGVTAGLPTAGNDGSIQMTLHQVNQDGAGPFTAAIDPTSGGTDAAAFVKAQVTQNVPGIGIGGLSAATTTDFPVTVQMPAGMVCNGTVGGVSGVCVVKMQNSALAGPFGGSAVFTQSAAAKKRALEYAELSKRHFARGVLSMPEPFEA